MIYTHARYAPLVMEVANDIDTANKCPGFTCGVVGGKFGPTGHAQGAQEPTPRWKQCAAITDQAFGEALAQGLLSMYAPHIACPGL
jgi:hypothetical protein